MKESKLNRNCIDHVLRACPRGVYYKIADKFTGGIPDSVFTWSGFTWWLEFKILDPNESIHDQLDKQQLIELIHLERECGRAWVIAFRRANTRKLVLPRTIIYRPSALWDKAVPRAVDVCVTAEGRARARAEVLFDLRERGVAEFSGFDYKAVSELIHLQAPGQRCESLSPR